MKYFAYGSNTNIEQMIRRCPSAEPIAAARARGWRLAFRGVADIVPAKGQVAHGVLWELDAAAERSLDRFEGFPHLYVKVRIPVMLADGTVVQAMAYVMRVKTPESPPNEGYLHTIAEGFDFWELPITALVRAVSRAAR